MDLLPRRENKANPFVPLIVNKDRYLDSAAETAVDQKALLTSPKVDQTAVTAANQAPLPTGNVAATGGNTGAAPIPPYLTPDQQTKLPIVANSLDPFLTSTNRNPFTRKI
jgi:hypothetical protein